MLIKCKSLVRANMHDSLEVLVDRDKMDRSSMRLVQVAGGKLATSLGQPQQRRSLANGG
jgi:hypothetical protein